MNAWVNAGEAMKYFGVGTLEDLEDIIVEFDLDTIVDDGGRLLAISGAEDMQEALFTRHERIVGHRPDDFEAHEAAVALHHETQRILKEQRKAERVKHVDQRVKVRKAKAAKEAKDGRPAGSTADTGA